LQQRGAKGIVNTYITLKCQDKTQQYKKCVPKPFVPGFRNKPDQRIIKWCNDPVRIFHITQN
jgi:hypothetical protein